MSSFVVSSPLGEFTTLTLGPLVRQLPRRIHDRPTEGAPVRFEWGGSYAATVENAIRPIAVPSHALVNGAPDRAMNGRSYAQTLAGGHLVQISYIYQNGPTITNQPGIFVIADSSVGPDTPLVHTLSVVFFPMLPGSRLYDQDGNFTEVPL